jgi:hypothetical protein
MDRMKQMMIFAIMTEDMLTKKLVALLLTFSSQEIYNPLIEMERLKFTTMTKIVLIGMNP